MERRLNSFKVFGGGKGGCRKLLDCGDVYSERPTSSSSFRIQADASCVASTVKYKESIGVNACRVY